MKINKTFKKLDEFFDKLSNILIVLIIGLALLFLTVQSKINYDKEIVKEAIKELKQGK